jgi:EmrB/QacA subfamily drug resistance transporter
VSTTEEKPLPRESAFPGHGEDDIDPRRWIALFVVLVATFMVLLDISIVNVAIPSIQRDLNASFGQIQLVLALYQLAYAVVLITGGRLGDIYGRKLLFMIGMSGFVIASALCGFAQSPEMLIGSRILQGLAASLMYPQVLSAIQVLFPPRERASAFAAFGAVIGLATIAGPLLGGILIQANFFGLDWRPIFLVNVPIGAGALVAAWFLLRESRSPTAPRLDLAGVVIVSLGLFLLVWPLVEGRDAGWPGWTFVSLAAALPVLAAFIWFERGQNARQASPLLVFSLFHNRAFDVGALVTFLFIAGLPAFFLTFSIFVQIGLGYSALHTGLTTLPFSIGSFFASFASARLSAQLGRNVLLIGNALLLLGMVLLLLTVHLAGTDLLGTQLIPAFLIAGLGLGAVIAPLVNVILGGVDPRDAGSASGFLTTIQQVAGAVGVAVIGVIFFGLLGSHATAVARDYSPALQRQLSAQHVPAPAAAQIVLAFQRCFHDRAAEKDPSVVPPSCRQTRTSPAVARLLAATAVTARKRDFSDAFDLSLIFNIVLWSVTFLLMLALPRRPRSLEGTMAGGH